MPARNNNKTGQAIRTARAPHNETKVVSPPVRAPKIKIKRAIQKVSGSKMTNRLSMAATTTVIPHAIVLEVLNRDNYEQWSFLVRTYLKSKELWDVVNAEPPIPEDKAWTKKNAEALHAIVISCGTDVSSIISSDTTTAKSAWDALERQSKAATAVVRERSDLSKKKKKKTERSVDTTTGPGRQASEEAEHENSTNPADLKRLKQFFECVTNGDWENAKQWQDNKIPVRAIDPRDESGDTALHVAAKQGHAEIVEALVRDMTREDLEKTNADGYTALGCAVNKGYGGAALVEIATYMVEKNNNILRLGAPPRNSIPVVEACGWSRWELARYLHSKTSHPDLETHGAQLLIFCFRQMEGLDIAWQLIERWPRLAFTKTREEEEEGEAPMLILASMHSGFFSGTRLKCWQKWIYKSICVKPVGPNIPDASIPVGKLENEQRDQSHLSFSVMSLFKWLAKELLKLVGFYEIYEQKLIHEQILEIVRLIGEATKNNDLTKEETTIVNTSIFRAIERGHVEFVTRICGANPRLVGNTYRENKSIFHFAIECRQEKIYSLIHGLEKDKIHNLVLIRSNDKNSMLHLTGNLSPLSRFNSIQGVALQMQRELQWFKEVETLVPRHVHESLNSSCLTARELFTQKHKKLMIAAESSMKATATSCTIVGALIVTIMFAAAFTFPGGNNGNTGFPMLIDKKLFKVFIYSDAVSLVTSTTSIVMFLGILTSGYSENDFLKSLPTKMMIGLFTLFVSIASMMITFSCALIIMVDGRNSSIVRTSITLASVPVTTFVLMQSSLLFETFKSTYGPGIFDKKMKPWY